MKSGFRALTSVTFLLSALAVSGPTTAAPGNGQSAGNGNQGNGNNGNHGNADNGNGNGNGGGSGNGYPGGGGAVVNTVPEPSTLLLSLAALGVLARVASRRVPPASRETDQAKSPRE